MLKQSSKVVTLVLVLSVAHVSTAQPQSNADKINTLLKKGQKMLNSGNYRQAIVAFEKVQRFVLSEPIRVQNTNEVLSLRTQLSYFIGLANYNLGRSNLAKKNFYNVIRLEKHAEAIVAIEAHRVLARIHKNQGRYKKSITLLKAVVVKYGKSMSPKTRQWCLLGWVLHMLNWINL